MEDVGLNSSAQTHPEFWRGKRVLMTGHTGFKGSWLSLWLQAMNAEVRGISLAPPTTPALFEIARVAAELDHQVADIRDYDKIRVLIREFEPEIVFHLAAQSLVRMSYQRPIETYATNLMGTVHVLEAAREVDRLRAIVTITTDKCYENREWARGYREDDPMGGSDPYSSSKGCAELVSSAYRKSFLRAQGIAMATARAGNVIGGGDWAPDRLVPDILRALENRQAALIRNPHSVRPWQHVLEPLSGYLILAERLYEHGQEVAEAWNFGPCEEDAQSVQQVVEQLCKAWGRDSTWALQPGTHPHEASYLKLDISKARQRLHWAPRWSLQTALQSTTDWHRAWLSGSDMRAYSLSQIREYQRNGSV
jgi:CDP-glucose 4,6-dehydratase